MRNKGRWCCRQHKRCNLPPGRLSGSQRVLVETRRPLCRPPASRLSTSRSAGRMLHMVAVVREGKRVTRCEHSPNGTNSHAVSCDVPLQGVHINRLLCRGRGRPRGSAVSPRRATDALRSLWASDSSCPTWASAAAPPSGLLLPEECRHGLPSTSMAPVVQALPACRGSAGDNLWAR